MPEPLIPTTKDQLFFQAILDKLEEMRCCVIDVEIQLEKLNTSPTVEPPTVQINIPKLAEALTPAIKNMMGANAVASVGNAKKSK